MRALISPLFALLVFSHPGISFEVTIFVGAALSFVRRLGLGSAIHCVRRHYRRGYCSGLFSLGRRGLIQTLWWRADRNGRWSGLVSVPFFGVDSVTLIPDPYARALVWARLCTLGRRGLSHCGGGPIDKGVGLVSPLFHWSASAQLLLCRADRQERMSGRTSVPLVGNVSITVLAGR